MAYDPLIIMGIAVSIGIGNSSIFYLYLDKSFVKRYKAFRDAFDKWMETEVAKFYERLLSMVVEKTKPAELLNFVNEWGTRTSNLTVIFETYQRVSRSVKWILILLVGSIVASALNLENPNRLNPTAPRPVFWIDIAIVLLFCAVLMIFYYIYCFHNVSSKVTQFELGEPIEKILGKT